MNEVKFTQYLLPDGRQRETTFEVEDENNFKKAGEIIEKGGKFEVEMLQTGMISLTVVYEEEDIAIQLTENNEKITKAVNNLIVEAYEFINK